MKKPTYDEDSDSIYFRLRSGKAYETMEISSHVLVDISHRDNQILGIEIVDASHFLSNLTAKRVDRNTIKNKLSLHLPNEGKEEVKISFDLDERNYTYVIPKVYRSPIVAIA